MNIANKAPIYRSKRGLQKAMSRDKILEAAARLFKQRGYDGVGIDEIMATAGMTAGGFYAHFPSKRALFAEVVKDLPTIDIIREAAASLPPEKALRSVMDQYLSGQHRDNVGSGCTVAPLAASISRADSEVKRAFDAAFESLSSEMQHLMGRSRDEVYPIIALLLGGLTLSRAVGKEEMSDRILSACRILANKLLPTQATQEKSEQNLAQPIR